MRLVKKVMFRLFSCALALVVPVLAGCAKEQPAPLAGDDSVSLPSSSIVTSQPEQPEQPDTDEPLPLTVQSIVCNYSETIFAIPWWGGHDGRVWACGYVKDAALTLETARPTIISMLPDGSDLTQLTPDILPLPALADQRDQLAAGDPAGTYFISSEFRAVLWNSTGEAMPVLAQTLYRRDTATDSVQSVTQLRSVCTLAADGTLQQGPTLQMPDQPAEYEQPYTVTGWLLTDDETLWCFTSIFDAAKNMYVQNQCLRFSLADGGLTAQVDLPDDRPVMDRRILTDGTLLLRCGPGTVYDMYVLQNHADAAPLLSQPLQLTVKEGLEAPFNFMHALSDQEQQVLLSATPTGVCQYNPETGDVEYLVLWKDRDIDGAPIQTMPFFIISENQFLVVERSELKLLTLG